MKRHWTKRHWITSAYLGLAMLTACQAQSPPGTTVVAQDESQFCGAQQPMFVPWNGKAPPSTGPTEIYLIYKDLAMPGSFVATRVDYSSGKFPYAVRFASGSLGSFIDSFDPATTFTVVVSPIPPKPIGDWQLAPILIEWAELAVNSQLQAQQAGDCSLPM